METKKFAIFDGGTCPDVSGPKHFYTNIFVIFGGYGLLPTDVGVASMIDSHGKLAY